VGVHVGLVAVDVVDREDVAGGGVVRVAAALALPARLVLDCLGYLGPVFGVVAQVVFAPFSLVTDFCELAPIGILLCHQLNIKGIV